MSVIARIIDQRRARLAESMRAVPAADMRGKAEGSPAPSADFVAAIRRGAPTNPIRLIAELKKASPSRGLIRPDFDPRAIARIYDQYADAMSVLTEEDFFQGRLSYIAEVKAVTRKPALRKDFIIDSYQIYEARAAGADAVLLIAMALEPAQAAEYLALARELKLGVLFEVHDLRELESTLRLGARVVGINNRDLGTLKTDLDTTFTLLREIPKGHVVVSESGINTRADVERLAAAGVDAMLVGTAIMNSPDIRAKLSEMTGR